MSSQKRDDREVNYVHFNTSDTFVPGVGNLGNSLPTATKSTKFRAFHTPEGVHVLFLDKKIEAMFPWSVVRLVTYKNQDASSLALVSQLA